MTGIDHAAPYGTAPGAPTDTATDTDDIPPAQAIGDEPSPTDAFGRAMRHDGWTPARQRRFLEFIADGHIVDHAARMVGLTATSAYALRRRPAGTAFALGWRAANLVARDHLADTMLERALQGTTETITRADGSVVERHRISDRLGLQLLARLDRQADATAASASAAPAAAGDATAARLVAGDFDGFLDLIGADAGPARAGLFLAAHGDAAGDLAELAALARADRARRALPAGDAADLDPADRHGWTADQWARAEAAGIVALAPSPAPAPQLPQLVTLAGAPAPVEASSDAPMAATDDPVWWCAASEDYHTHFPPPPGFYGDEHGGWGDYDYERALSPDERASLGLPDDDDLDQDWAEAAAERDAFFAREAAAATAPTPVPEPGAPDPTTPEPPASGPAAGPDAPDPGTPPPPAR